MAIVVNTTTLPYTPNTIMYGGVALTRVICNSVIVWELIRIVTWDAQGGAATETTRQVESGSPVGTLPAASWVGHEFVGWFDAWSGGVQITSSYVVTSDITFYARWTVGGTPIVVGGFNGGGAGGTANNDTAGGGGATDIRVMGQALLDRVIVAGGGGSSGCSSTIGGDGGGTSGTPAVDTHTAYGGPGGPGTQTSGGVGGTNSGPGTFGQGGSSGVTQAWPGGGGGGGWYGGGAGGNMPGGGGAGGGGSGYIGGVQNGSMQNGINTGNGKAKITGPTGITYDFGYTGAGQTFIAPIAGTYTFEVWGAEGGNSTHGIRGGYGGYAKGNYTLTAGQLIYVFVGAMGKNESV